MYDNYMFSFYNGNTVSKFWLVCVIIMEICKILQNIYYTKYREKTLQFINILQNYIFSVIALYFVYNFLVVNNDRLKLTIV